MGLHARHDGHATGLAARMEGIVVEELAGGDAGLAVSAGAGVTPMLMAMASGQK